MVEIGCGLDRVAFPIRDILPADGSYAVFDVCAHKVKFVRNTYTQDYPNFRVSLADIINTHYCPHEKIPGAEYYFSFSEDSFYLVFAASVYTHIVPKNTLKYF